MPVPAVDPNTILATFPETWNALVEAAKAMGTDVATLTEQGITTYGALIEYMEAQNFHPVYLQTISETFAGWAKSSAVDPTSTTDVGFRMATDVAVTGGAGTAVSTFTSGGNRTLGLVTKMVALGACLSLLVSEIGAGLVADDIQEDLITSIDPYTIDGENVPVLIDEDGKTHLMNDMIEAVRAKAVELGLYSTGGWYANLSGHTFNPNITAVLNLPLKPASIGDVWADTTSTTSSRYWTLIEKVNCELYAVNSNDTGSLMGIVLDENEPATFKLLDGTGTVRTYNIRAGSYTMRVDGVNISIPKGTLWSGVLVSKVNTTMPINIQSGSGNASGNWEYGAGYVHKYGTQVSAIDGMTPNSQTEALLKDLTNPFTAAFPNIGTGLDTATPTEADLTHKTKWYPVNVKHVNPFTDGLTTTDTDTSTVTDGDTDDDTEDEIVELLKGLYEALNRDPEDPTQPVPPPTIEVSDSGDTPPSNPPLVSGSANGLWKIYNPLEADIQAFGSWLWSSSVIDQVVRMFNSPIDAVIALHQIYCTPVRGASANIMCGFLDSGVPSTYTVANQYQTIDCGDVNVGEYYRTAVDYVATKIELYLPFIGIVPLSASVVMGSTLNVTYRIDVLTGTCLAQVKVIKQNSDAVMYTFAGNCACQIPLTATTYTGMVGTLVNSVQAGLSFMAGDIIQGAGEIGSALRDGMTGLTGTKKSGSLGANAGALGIRIPYLIITHPTVYDAYLYNEQYGYPSNKTVQLGSVSGYTKVKDIHLSGVPCTDEELAEIERLLKNGVIIN